MGKADCEAARTGDLQEALASLLRAKWGEAPEVSRPVRMSGGSSRETWSFEASSPSSSGTLYVLRRDPPGALMPGVAREARLLDAARRAGVPVPRVVATPEDAPEEARATLGDSFVVVEHVAGETIPRRILDSPDLAQARKRLAAQCGEVLARIHSVDPGSIGGLDASDVLEGARRLLDWLGEPHPAFELGFRRLEATRPASSRNVLVHGDFRNGNLIVGEEGIRAVLDWELAHIGDPLEDLGWLCVKAWRFGSELPVGGFGTYDDLVAAYEAASGEKVDRQALEWWEAVGTLRWGIFCILQAHMHTSGRIRSVELAAIGRRVCEQEWDLLDLFGVPRPPKELALGGALGGMTGGATTGALGGVTAGATGGARGREGFMPNDAPSATALLEAVRAFLAGEVAETSTGRLRFHAKVAANVVDMVSREIVLGEEAEVRRRARLERLGVKDEAELASAIRSGAMDERMEEVEQAVREEVADKLAVANPTHLC